MLHAEVGPWAAALSWTPPPDEYLPIETAQLCLCAVRVLDAALDEERESKAVAALAQATRAPPPPGAAWELAPRLVGAPRLRAQAARCRARGESQRQAAAMGWLGAGAGAEGLAALLQSHFLCLSGEDQAAIVAIVNQEVDAGGSFGSQGLRLLAAAAGSAGASAMLRAPFVFRVGDLFPASHFKARARCFNARGWSEWGPWTPVFRTAGPGREGRGGEGRSGPATHCTSPIAAATPEAPGPPQLVAEGPFAVGLWLELREDLGSQHEAVQLQCRLASVTEVASCAGAGGSGAPDVAGTMYDERDALYADERAALVACLPASADGWPSVPEDSDARDEDPLLGSWHLLVTLPPLPALRLSGLAAGRFYVARCRVRNAIGWSAWSEPSAVTRTGGAPVMLRARRAARQPEYPCSALLLPPPRVRRS